MDTYIVRRLEQAKLLTDPFKLRLIEGFAGVPATTKQVADKMGEKAPRLYRHVDALVEEGLLKLVEEKPKRGTIERYYKTVADRFEVDPQLFSPAAGVRDEAVEMMRSLIRDTESDLVRLLGDNGDSTQSDEDSPLLARFVIRGSPEVAAELRKKLEAWLEECDGLSAEEVDPDGSVAYAGLLTFYRRPEPG